MALTPGTRIGSYEITTQIGVGGMGEVYRATDTKLKRQVAIKVLPEALAGDAERLARFQREAEVLASLNHPNIAAIHGLEDADGSKALVMELVEGPTLADRIAQGPIPEDETRAIAKQIAEALDAAHGQGIIHRDLKPANVKVRSDGAVKVLDFGLAKAMEPTGVLSSSQSLSPTITTPAMTQAGLILGTASYMSPEQARGKPADRRADIWAFGCLLYEMLTGQQAFPGEEVSDALAKVIEREPDLNALPTSTSAGLRRILARTLQKKIDRRWRDIGDVLIELDAASEPERAATPSPGEGDGVGRRRAVVIGLAALVTASLTTGAATWWLTRPGPPSLVQLEFVPETPVYIQRGQLDLAVTPDGRSVVYSTIANGRGALHMRPLDSDESVLLVDGLGYVTTPFVSPDGAWVGFGDGTEGTLRRVRISGLSEEIVCSVDGGFLQGATWGPDETIVFATSAPGSGLWRVDADGGEPSLLTTPDPDRGEQDHVWPDYLPGGRAVVFTTLSSVGDPVENAKAEVLLLDTGERRELLRGATGARYVPSGHLVFGAGGGLYAVAFDLNRLEVVGDSVRVLDTVLTKTTGAIDLGISGSGVLAYLEGGSVTGSSLVWVDREGHAETAFETGDELVRPRVSPDGRLVAFERSSGGSIDIWTYDFERGTANPVTFLGAVNDPVWAPGGNRLAFSATEGTTGSMGSIDLFSTSVSGGGDVELLWRSDTLKSPHAWHPEGRVLAYYERGGSTSAGGRDIWLLSREDDGEWEARPLLATRFNERSPIFSPDGAWLAYASDESGRDQIYVRSYPDGDDRYTVSTNGGTEPTWSPDGRELFYREGLRMMAVSVDTTHGWQAGSPEELLSGNYLRETDGSGSLSYDVAPDGRFLLVQQQTDPSASVKVSLGWLAELERLVPTN